MILNRKTITISAYNRTTELATLLDQLLAYPDIKYYHFVIGVDYSYDYQGIIEHLIDTRLKDKVNYNLVCHTTHMGDYNNYNYLLKYVFDHLKSDFNWDFEDDDILVDGWSNLMEFYEKYCLDDSSIFSYHLRGFSGGEKVEKGNYLYKCYTFGAHGTGLKKTDWDSWYRNFCEQISISPSDKFVDYEGLTLNQMKKLNVYSIRPSVTRVLHQKVQGHHMTPESSEYFNSMMFQDEPYNDYYIRMLYELL